MKSGATSPNRVVIIGGGAAGLFAAGRAAELGARVLLLEKMPHPGMKLNITGKGRCNVTNMAPTAEFITHFGRNGRFLRQALSRFSNADLVEFLEQKGVRCVTERGDRVFPASNRAEEITSALTYWLNAHGAEIRTLATVLGIATKDQRVSGVTFCATPYGKAPATLIRAADSKTAPADSVILATGGASYPATGSTGDGYDFAEETGHRVIPARPALVPLVTSGPTAKRLQGLSLKNVTAALLVDGEKRRKLLGEMLFTHFGLSGPIILTLSREAGDELKDGKKVEISIDLKPALDESKLDARLIREFQAQNRRQFQTILKTLLPQKLIPVCIDLTKIPADKQGHHITAGERNRLCGWLKNFKFEVLRTRSFKEAIVTAGGVDLKQIDPRTMESKLIKGLFFAGEVIDLDGDTGGFNLQAAFSTGWVAGSSAAGG
ncbi:MAG: NAD(P)/FAD-dependent oxidoreductase [Candidatus Eisenbacteria bacterium]|uniref:NAD(P)/FAD-dependent oxidoreductase n=1 Tax=Eiseniibacteriota bacterium TaxID=2212470 RepID=A0A948W5U3_UNCEI|nr:NAD(P)/FAD-dependent oxidoreductase [Candidatus Eisenbacteria bacterium]MBU1947080.1 NAD(P)/FAD-dependent oxidoreductase [Candidatus Eisenbacteria bacterium]MBU2690804.1 NAD(P)/FAD-dependent oxidoreductase [Candidatus Eisenbacteria bacterium]